MKSRFDLGQVVVTRGVNDRISEDAEFAKGVQLSLTRHNSGDWGEIDDEGKASNDAAVKEKDRILSAYEIGNPKTKIWIITEWDRSVTTVLFPDEY